jgi:ABC-type transport system substrate-binding protein
MRLCLFTALLLTLASLYGCTPNDPYRPDERDRSIFYTTFNEPPKHLDPARSYSSDEYAFIGVIYAPPLQYHYLDRPYRLIPLTVESMPEPIYYGTSGKELSDDAPASKVKRAVYTITLKRGMQYQPHPAFATKSTGAPLYRGITEKTLGRIHELSGFKETGTREVLSDDYILQIKRLADPLVASPVLPILEKYILGLKEYSESLRAELEELRAGRRAAQGASYNQTLDEQRNPIRFDYDKYPLPGVERIDDHSYKILLGTKYPQFIYWLAMPFFSPVPAEALDFYAETALIKRNITLDRFPIGTGPYMIESYNPNMEIVIKKNPNFYGETYPARGAPGDTEAGLLKDAGRPLPLTERVVFKLEKEAIPRWSKFLQGYYDSSGINSDSFDQAVSMSASGQAELTSSMLDKKITLKTAVQPTTMYMSFNMLDDVVGGYSANKQKLRQAISIALDYEEFIEIFNNGRGIAAMSPLPPGIFGRREGKSGINPYVYDWDETKNRPVRKSIEEAKRLLAEAGYAGGRTPDGVPLKITFDNAWTGPDYTPMINWYVKRLKLLGIQLENRTTDYNRFREKVMKGNFQLLFWGWNADYPDPENFMFLLAGHNGKVKFQGENTANYASKKYDALFKKMENMGNTPERLAIIDKMTAILQKDAPWVWGYHRVAFGLYHSWVQNVKSNAMANNTTKYIRIEVQERNRARKAWNPPVLWPVALIVIIIAGLSIPAIIAIRRKRGG